MEWFWNYIQYAALPAMAALAVWISRLDERLFNMNSKTASREELEGVRKESAGLIEALRDEVRMQITDLKDDMGKRFDRIENLLDKNR